jgi:hypothetical protein
VFSLFFWTLTNLFGLYLGSNDSVRDVETDDDENEPKRHELCRLVILVSKFLFFLCFLDTNYIFCLYLGPNDSVRDVEAGDGEKEPK